ncbi:G-protein coupled receptor dmsr-1-like isoform X2 [Artemia franciscana]
MKSILQPWSNKIVLDNLRKFNLTFQDLEDFNLYSKNISTQMNQSYVLEYEPNEHPSLLATESHNRDKLPYSVIDFNTSDFTSCELLKDFHAAYENVHGYLSLIICVIGTISNSVNIIILRHRDLISPFNNLLCALAVADGLVMLEYIPYAVHMYITPQTRKKEDYLSYGWTLFTLIHANFTVVIHTVSIWITLTLAFWRYLSLKNAGIKKVFCSEKGSIVAIIVAFLGSIILCIPCYLTFAVSEEMDNSNNGTKTYVITVSEMARSNGELLLKIQFWIFGVFVKIVPCCILTILTTWLVRQLVTVRRRQKRLQTTRQKSANRVPPENLPLSTEEAQLPVKKTKGRFAIARQSMRQSYKRRTCSDWTTKLLISLLMIFLVTEVPQGISALISAIKGEEFSKNCLYKLGDLFDALALFNSAINFAVYLSMNRQFRNHVCKLFNCSNCGPDPRLTVPLDANMDASPVITKTTKL